MKLEGQIEKLEQEIKDIKAAFMVSANHMDIKTIRTSITTEVNLCSFSNSGSWDTDKWMRIITSYQYQAQSQPMVPAYCEEIVEVTFRSANGSNVILNLEVQGAQNTIFTQRVPFNGGAQWILRLGPNVTPVYNPDYPFVIDYYTWQPTVLTLAVQSGVPGTLEARMKWD